MTPIQVVGIGLEGAAGLSPPVRSLVEQAAVLVGSDRHLSYFPKHPGERWYLQSFAEIIDRLQAHLRQGHPATVVVLTSGDPLFFGLGRLLLAELPPDQITFHPHLSSIQLAFSRVKLPWQEAAIISAHGRSLEALIMALRRGQALLAVLTDRLNTPSAIGQLVLELDLPVAYDLWVCENLGGEAEQIHALTPETVIGCTFAPLNVVILQQRSLPTPEPAAALPTFGIPDGAFLTFSDRPGLMTKREVRVQILGELGLQPGQVIWDIGAGTGSVSVEIGRLFPDAQIFAVEKVAMGASLIAQNSDRFGVSNVKVVHGAAPDALAPLPAPDRVFIGGSGGQIQPILEYCGQRLAPQGQITLALATLEHLHQVMVWLQAANQIARDLMGATGDQWTQRSLQVNISRSVAVHHLTRWLPLNPVTLVTIVKT